VKNKRTIALNAYRLINLFTGNVELAAQKAHSTYIKTLRRVHSDLIASSDVCLSTCMSASAWEMGTADFPIVFIDEAGQCDEPTTLVPLMKGSQHAVLIGDHKQLPSVCSSGDARREGLNRSLFERLKLSSCEYSTGCMMSLGSSPDPLLCSAVPSVQLDTQYRMHPHISAFPNKQFYLGSIKDSDERIASMTTHNKQPVVFYHHTHAESKSGQSIINDGEADDIVRLLLRLQRDRAAKGQDEKTTFSNIGIISMYAAQKELIRRKVRDALGDDHGVEIHTVDGFQGRDKDTIIISTARSNSGGFKGFLTDPRRMNVALTRARNQLYVFGNANTLEAFQAWARETPVTAEYINWLRKVCCLHCKWPSDYLLMFWDCPQNNCIRP
jgi:superfamily I DNA and/or RNA helicase